jgi:hypothetical protein
MVYFVDDTNSHWKDRMIRLIKMLENNIINIVNDTGSMTAYPFV